MLNKLMQGEHVARHNKGLRNGIWTDMYIETTFVWYRKGPGELIDLRFKPKVVKKWAYGLKTCIRIIEDLEQMSKTILEKNQLVNKEEG